MHELITPLFEDVWTKGDMTAADNIFAANHVSHDPAHPWIARGAEGVKRIVAVYRNAFPDLAITVDDCLEHGGRVVTRWTFTGTHLGLLFHLAQTGKHVSFTGMQFDRVERGRIVETWSLWDMAGLWMQLGVLPAAFREDTEAADLSYWKTHKMWWQRDELGRDDEHNLLDDRGPGA